jgi:hypothetical protein
MPTLQEACGRRRHTQSKPGFFVELQGLWGGSTTALRGPSVVPLTCSPMSRPLSIGWQELVDPLLKLDRSILEPNCWVLCLLPAMGRQVRAQCGVLARAQAPNKRPDGAVLPVLVGMVRKRGDAPMESSS